MSISLNKRFGTTPPISSRGSFGKMHSSASHSSGKSPIFPIRASAVIAEYVVILSFVASLNWSICTERGIIVVCNSRTCNRTCGAAWGSASLDCSGCDDDRSDDWSEVYFSTMACDTAVTIRSVRSEISPCTEEAPFSHAISMMNEIWDEFTCCIFKTLCSNNPSMSPASAIGLRTHLSRVSCNISYSVGRISKSPDAASALTSIVIGVSELDPGGLKRLGIMHTIPFPFFPLHAVHVSVQSSRVYDSAQYSTSLYLVGVSAFRGQVEDDGGVYEKSPSLVCERMQDARPIKCARNESRSVMSPRYASSDEY